MKRYYLRKKILIDYFDWDEFDNFEEIYSKVEKVIGKVHDDDIEGFNTSIYLVKNGKEELFLEYELKYETIKRTNLILTEIKI